MHVAQAHQEQLQAAFDRIFSCISRSLDGVAEDAAPEPAFPPPVALLAERFELSAFECDVLLLTVAVEMDGRFVELCERINGDGNGYATFGMALATLPDAAWSATLPTAPLRYWHLIEMERTSTVGSAPLRVDEAILDTVLGLRYLDERLLPSTLPFMAGGTSDSQRRIAADVQAALGSERAPGASVQLCGVDSFAKRGIAERVCTASDLPLVAIEASTLVAEQQGSLIQRLWQREAMLGLGCLFIDAERIDEGDNASWNIIAGLIDKIPAPVLLSTRAQHALGARPTIAVMIDRPTRAEQREAWRDTMVAGALHELADELAYQFDFSFEQIESTWRTSVARFTSLDSQPSVEAIREIVWDTARDYARTNLDELAHRIQAKASWDDLIVTEETGNLLRSIAAQVRARSVVYDEWGVAERTSRGLGISVLFSGASGTGKTMAAEVLARELRTDLYRVDLSAMVSKYIGETEKNLRRIFDAAESAGVVLLFDEADALFGKRGEVKESHDRFANVEVSYLLQRMEEYSGLSILTTNLKNNIDVAFLRRVRFAVDFPFPGKSEREQIWRRALASPIPSDAIEFSRISELNVAGGDIRNIALNAAFRAGSERRALQMDDILRATRIEFAKLERTLSAAEARNLIGGS